MIDQNIINHIKNTKTTMAYKHLTKDERTTISAFNKAGWTQTRIADAMGLNQATISRELSRNSVSCCTTEGNLKTQTNQPINKLIYNPTTAQKHYKERRVRANKDQLTKIVRGGRLWEHIVTKMTIDNWSPEQIAGRMKVDWDKLHSPGKSDTSEPLEYTVTHETIYKWLYGLALNKDNKDDPNYKDDLELKNQLTLTLRYNKGKYRRRHGTRQRRKECEEMKKNRIDTRPAEVETRERIGDWEGDTIVGDEKSIHILTHVERRSGYLLADKLDHATAEQTQLKTLARFRLLPDNKKHSLTYDNGAQFSLHQGTEQKSGIPIFFAYPYHSWERGTNENTNGLLRQYYPKGSPFSDITQQALDQVVDLINNRPRKRLNYLTPHEVFELGMTF
jgi:transposase, IS30 family